MRTLNDAWAGPLFDPPMTADQKRDWLLKRDVELLTPIAAELIAKAEERGAKGIAANDVRTTAEARGILLAYSDRIYLGRVSRKALQAAGLVLTKERTTTPRIGKRGGNSVQLWARRRVA